MIFNFDIAQYDQRRLYALGDFIEALALIAQNEAAGADIKSNSDLNTPKGRETTQSVAAHVDEIIDKAIAETEEKPKRTRRTKAEIEAANASAGESVTAAAPVSTSTAAATTTAGVSAASLSDDVDDLFGETPVPKTYASEWAAFQAANEGVSEEKFKRDLLQRVVAKVGMDSARGLMLSLGAKNVSEVTGDKRQTFFEKVSEILA